MVLPEENCDKNYVKLLDLCGKLNLDEKTIESAWEGFQIVYKNFVLEGDVHHWLGCAVFAAQSQTNKGNIIILTSLLRHSNLSFDYFFHNMKKWSEMASLPDEFHKKILRLEDTFSIAHNTFREYVAVFNEVFLPITYEDIESKPHRNRKQKPLKCTKGKLFEFIWNLFVTLKCDNVEFALDLIKSYHLLYAVVDLLFKNAYVDERRDLINPQFLNKLQQASFNTDKSPKCIIKHLCKSNLHLTEAMHTKIYLLKQLLVNYMKNANRKALLMSLDDFTGLIHGDNFEQNYKSVVNAYEISLSNKIEIDERIFLSEHRRRLLQQRIVCLSFNNVDNSLESPVNNEEQTLKINDTPLTGKRFVMDLNEPNDSIISNINQMIMIDRTTNQNISKLQAILKDRTSEPGKNLLNIFKSCQNDPQEKISGIIKELSDKYINVTTVLMEKDDISERLKLSVTLFYKLIENIFVNEKTIHDDISALVDGNIFYYCMFACCLEIVNFTYNQMMTQCQFPWVLTILNVEAFHFVKIIELIIRSSNLSREIVKHLSKIEETSLESLIWKSNSELWIAIEKSGNGVPKFEQTALPGHVLYKNDEKNEKIKKSENDMPSALDTFNQSPVNKSGIQAGRSVLKGHTHIMISDKDGNKKIIPIVDNSSTIKTEPNDAGINSPIKKMGSVEIIFRKVYHLAGIRMEHLCLKLGIRDFKLKQKIWTVFEESIQKSALIKDRHLDQLLMCAIYVICRILDIQSRFQDIMRYYRLQPQSTSSVYRQVLLDRRTVDENGIEKKEKTGDLIRFYNKIYVPEMEKIAIKFHNKSEINNLILSPLPTVKRTCKEVQVLENVYVRPLESPMPIKGPSLNYYFSRSPSKDLKEINKFVNSSNGNGGIRKRLLENDDNETPPLTKRYPNKKLQLLVEERKNQNNSE